MKANLKKYIHTCLQTTSIFPIWLRRCLFFFVTTASRRLYVYLRVMFAFFWNFGGA